MVNAVRGLLLDDCALVRSSVHSESVVHRIPGASIPLMMGKNELLAVATDQLGAKISTTSWRLVS